MYNPTFRGCLKALTSRTTQNQQSHGLILLLRQRFEVTSGKQTLCKKDRKYDEIICVFQLFPAQEFDSHPPVPLCGFSSNITKKRGGEIPSVPQRTIGVFNRNELVKIPALNHEPLTQTRGYSGCRQSVNVKLILSVRCICSYSHGQSRYTRSSFITL